MTCVAFTIPGRISGKGRPRAANIGGFVRVYTPKKTRSEEKMIAILARAAMQGSAPLAGPLSLEVVIVQRPPPSWSKAKVQSANWIVSGFDLDNGVKLVSDSLNGIAYEDDRQIARITAERVWRTTGEERVEVRVSTLD